MTMQYIKITCDVCGREIADSETQKIVVPSKVSNSDGTNYMTVFNKSFDVCEDCKKKFAAAVFEHFAEISDTLGHIEVKRKANS